MSVCHPEAVLHFWFERLGPEQRFVKDAAIDERLCREFSIFGKRRGEANGRLGVSACVGVWPKSLCWTNSVAICGAAMRCLLPRWHGFGAQPRSAKTSRFCGLEPSRTPIFVDAHDAFRIFGNTRRILAFVCAFLRCEHAGFCPTSPRYCG